MPEKEVIQLITKAKDTIKNEMERKIDKAYNKINDIISHSFVNLTFDMSILANDKIIISPTDGATYSNGKLTKINSETWSNGGAYSNFSVEQTARIFFRAGNVHYGMYGLNPIQTINYTEIAHCIYLENGHITIYKNGTSAGRIGTFTADDSFTIFWDGTYIYYYQNGKLIYEDTLIGEQMYFCSDIYTQNGYIYDLKFSEGIANLPVIGTFLAQHLLLTSDNKNFEHRGIGSSASAWQGRIVGGGSTTSVLLGEYKSLAGIGAHNAALNSWAALYIQPDGDFPVYIGKNGTGWTNEKGVVKIQGSSTENGGSVTIYGTLDATNINTGNYANTIVKRDNNGHINVNYLYSTWLKSDSAINNSNFKSFCVFDGSQNGWIYSATSADVNKKLNIFSTSEQTIGTWIDGKTIYRKTFEVNKSISQGESFLENIDLSSISFSNIWVNLNYSLMIGDQYSLNEYMTQSVADYWNTYIDIVNKKLYYRGQAPDNVNKFIITIEYTKQ